jgi:exodeoxyribonuclease VIII
MLKYESIKALNWSSLKEVSTSPRAYRWRQDHPREDTAALAMGRAVHCAILEPAEFAARYIVRPADIDGRTKAGKAWLDDARASGREVLTADQGETVEECVASVRAHHDVAELLEGCATEQVVTWTDPGTGVACKGRLDALTPRTVIDLKTTRELARFEQDAARLLYHAQVAWYLDGARAAGVVDDDARAWIVAVETVGPFDCGPLEVAGADLDAGREVYRRLLDTWVSCRETGEWYGRIPVGRRLELPRWAPGFEPEEVSP